MAASQERWSIDDDYDAISGSGNARRSDSELRHLPDTTGFQCFLYDTLIEHQGEIRVNGTAKCRTDRVSPLFGFAESILLEYNQLSLLVSLVSSQRELSKQARQTYNGTQSASIPSCI